jgi:hypothetical protein
MTVTRPRPGWGFAAQLEHLRAGNHQPVARGDTVILAANDSNDSNISVLVCLSNVSQWQPMAA